MPGTRIRRSRGVKAPAVIGVTSPAFQDSSDIPSRYSRAGGNISPALSWSALPKKTASVALICEDPDAPGHEPFTHWVLFNVPPNAAGLPEGVAQGAHAGGLPGAGQGVNDFGNVGYDGPAPPRGDGIHRYQFQIYALDDTLPLSPGATAGDLWEAMKDHILGKGVLVGVFSL
jgi:Raf kinase inhibitor-like YbhB/YbcL family protein